MEVIQEALSNIGFNWQVALANFVNFLIIFWLLKRFAFKPIQQKIEERNKIIADGVAKAKQAEEKLAQAQSAYEDKITEAKREAYIILESAAKEKELVLLYAHEQAEKKGVELIQRAQESIAREEKVMKKEFNKYATELSVSIAEKLIGDSLDATRSEKLTQEILKKHA